MTRIAVFDCPLGIAGDMTVGAFLDAGMSFRELAADLRKLKLRGYVLRLRHARAGAFRAKKFSVCLSDKVRRHHVTLREITALIRHSGLHASVRRTAIAIFRNLGRAEARVHGVKLSEIHFHEVGAVDSILDIVGAAVCVHRLGIGEAYVRSISVGRGTHAGTGHGRMPVPVPGACELLKGFWLDQSAHDKEMVTPTGAAILATLCRKVKRIPRMKLEAVGYGAGDRKFGGERGYLRVVLGRRA